MLDKEAIDTDEFRTSNSTVNKQMVVVKVTLSNGKATSKKVIHYKETIELNFYKVPFCLEEWDFLFIHKSK